VLPDVSIIAGLAWDPGIRGILTVALGVAILLGSVYVIVATNTGARLGMLIALGSLFGWMSIMCLYWWIIPPGIGPKGQDPSWRPVEIVIHEPDARPAKTPEVNQLPDPANLPTAVQIVEANPDLEGLLVSTPENTTLSDLKGVAPEVLTEQYGLNQEGQLNGWKLLSTSQAGDAAAAADVALAESGLFTDATAYKKLDAFKIGGQTDREDECPGQGEGEEGTGNLVPEDPLCRAWARIRKTFNLWQPPLVTVVQVQPVVPQVAEEGQAPPTPVVDEEQPVVSVVLVRDQGSVRAKPAYFFAICFALFIVFVLVLHYRDKTLKRNMDEAEVVRTDGKG
jgi:hypothetical protein